MFKRYSGGLGRNTTQLHFVVFRVEEFAHKLDNILSNY